MSNFNDANELASNLVFGTNYHDNKPIAHRPKQLTFHLTRRIIVKAEANTHEEWVKVAKEIQDILDEGFWYDAEDDEPDYPELTEAQKDEILDNIEDL